MVRVSLLITLYYNKLYYAGTNDAFVTIGLAREKFQTSVKEKTVDPEWSEQCQL